MENDATKAMLPSKEALNEFLKTHKYKFFPTAIEAIRSGKTVWIAECRKGTGRSRGKTYKIGGKINGNDQ